MATLQIRIDDELKIKSDNLFSSLGLDTPTAVRIFLTAAQEYDGFPFAIGHRRISQETAEAVSESRRRINLNGPYATAEEAVAAMLDD